jgi:tetratricopeptide (TPR) repeat protein
MKELRLLIHSLQASERRYFSLYLKRNMDAKGKKYIQLFQFLSELAIDEPAKSITQNYAPSDCNYLYRHLLKSLRAYHEERTVTIRIREYLTNAEILAQRQLYSGAIDELKRAEDLAENYQHYYALAEILFNHVELVISQEDKNMKEEVIALHQRLKAITELIHLEQINRVLHDNSFVLLRTRYHLRSDELQGGLTQIEQEFNAMAVHSDSFRIGYFQKNACAVLAICKGNLPDAVKSYEELIEHWKKFPRIIKEEQIKYKKCVGNYLVMCHANSFFDKIPPVIRELRNLQAASADEEAEDFQSFRYVELLHLMNTDGFDRLDVLVKEIETGLERYKAKVNKAREIAFCHNIGMSYFLLHDWKKSLHWMERIIKQEKTEHRQDLQHTARMLRLVLWYELNKHDLLEYELINVERFLRKRKAWFAYESTVVKFFGKLLLADGVEKKKLLQKFSDQLTLAVEGKTSAALPGSSELAYWAKMYLTGKTMRGLLAEPEQ